MSDSSSKSEGYSSIIQDAAVPSTPLCCFIVFIILKSYLSITGIYGTIFTFIFFILFVLTSILTIYKYRNLLKNKRILFFSATIATLIFFIISFLLADKIAQLKSDLNLPEYIENTSITVESVIFKRYSSEIYFHKTEDSDAKIKGILNFQGENYYSKGDQLFLHKKIKKIPSDSKIQFNTYLLSRGIHFTADISESDITVIKKSEIDFKTSLQKTLLDRIDLLFKTPTAGLIKALLTGNQNYVEKKIILEYRNSGVLHCLSASGMHVAIFAAIPAFLLIPFFRKNIAMLASLTAILFYLFITDMPVSLLRAVIMFGFLYLQLLLFRKRNVFNYLMLTCAVILYISPWEIFSPGFQLSFAATAGILIFYKQYRYSLKGFPAVIADTTAVTLSAQIVTLPIILFHMNQVNTSGLIANIIIIPLITLIMGMSIFVIMLSYISFSAAVFGGVITHHIFRLTLFITTFISNLELNFYVYNLTIPLILILLISLIPLINSRRSKQLKFYPILLSALLCTIYLKKNYQFNSSSYIITNNNSKAEITREGKRQSLKLSLEEDCDIDNILREVKTKNPDIKIIELCNDTSSTLVASKRIMNDYMVDEFRFNKIPDLNNMLKKIIFQLEKDNVIVKFTKESLPD